MADVSLTPEFERRIRGVFGDDGERWIADLPSLIARCEARWSLRVGAPFPLSYNYVAPAMRADGSEVVMKAGVPQKELWCEIAALRHYDGQGAVRLLDADADAGVMLLERMEPGHTLAASVEDDTEATAIAGGLMRTMWRPPPAGHAFPTVGDWSRALGRIRAKFEGGTGPLPTRVFEMAESSFGELLASDVEQVLLHGDFHHENILLAERAPWLIIDPKGVVGDPGYEVGALLGNPGPRDWSRKPGAKEKLRRRLDILTEVLEIDRARLVAWGIAFSVMSACWTVEDHEVGWEHAMGVAEVLADGV